MDSINEKPTRNYDINAFDWDSPGQAENDQAKVESTELLIRQALQATSPRGDAWLRPSAVDSDRARITYNVHYALDEEKKEHLKDLVGDLRTLTFNASDYHDHPLSHSLTEISEDLVVRKFADEPFVSVWGNAGRHRRMGHVGAKVVSSRHVPHDWFRNRGMEESVTQVDQFVRAKGHMKYRLFLGTHALYYMTMEDVACWLGGNPNAEFHGIIHRHGQTHGHLNKGELKYDVDADGIVTQVNPLTGFSYGHRSMEPLFHSDSCRVFGGRVGLAWDIGKLAGDNYHVKIVLCSPDNCMQLQDPWELVKTDREVYVRGDVTVYRCLSFEWYVYHAQRGEVLLEDVELYDRLRRTIAGKERTPRAKSDLMAMCRRLSNKNDIISVHQGYSHEVPPELMTDYVNAAFYADVKHELEVALAYHKENKQAIDALNRFISEGKAPVDFTIIANVGRAVVKPFQSLSGLIKDRQPIVQDSQLLRGPGVRYAAPPTNPFRIGIGESKEAFAREYVKLLGGI